MNLGDQGLSERAGKRRVRGLGGRKQARVFQSRVNEENRAAGVRVKLDPAREAFAGPIRKSEFYSR